MVHNVTVSGRSPAARFTSWMKNWIDWSNSTKTGQGTPQWCEAFSGRSDAFALAGLRRQLQYWAVRSAWPMSVSSKSRFYAAQSTSSQPLPVGEQYVRISINWHSLWLTVWYTSAGGGPLLSKAGSGVIFNRTTPAQNRVALISNNAKSF